MRVNRMKVKEKAREGNSNEAQKLKWFSGGR